MTHTLAQVRQAFLSFFEDRAHTVVPSSPLVPQNDPSLLFTNAGMVQFKNVFIGAEKRPFTRAASVQKCLRAGGKHNDLENVGYTKRHHTFFEMLGNFSFGDYFKEEAIAYAWAFLTGTLQLPREKLYVTVHISDEESAQLWRKVADIDDARIIRIGTNDNFWMMGDTGPCGPCTEIFYDHGPHVAGGLPGTPDQDGDRYVEVWNVVFMAFEQMVDGTRVSLPKPCVDTGIGLERLTAILQGKSDNYDIDLMRLLIEASAALSHTSPDDTATKTSHRVVADHLRAMCFLIADGVLPSNEGRGYVLRRIMRRAIRHSKKLGVRQPMLATLAPTLIEAMKNPYAELERAAALIKETIHSEEERFWETLDKGMKLLNEHLVGISSGMPFPGQVAFMLYDTYGFPLDLTEDILRPLNVQVDKQAFDQAMAQQKEASRRAWVGSGQVQEEANWLQLAGTLPATRFLGYDVDSADATVLAQIGGVYIVCDQTPFYAEQGGQVGDKGFLDMEDGTRLAVVDVQKKGDLYVHHLESPAPLAVGARVHLAINRERRQAIRANHSATHLLHGALKSVLGEHVHQKGSLVDDEKLRFDFSHSKPVTREQLVRLEKIVNAAIRQDAPTQSAFMAKDEALKSGAQALFGEKYPDKVRVVHIADTHELCGGTHVARTGEIGFFKFTHEASVASGIRRLEAVTGQKALDYVQACEQTLEHVAGALRVGVGGVLPALTQAIETKKKLEHRVAHLTCHTLFATTAHRVVALGMCDLWSQSVHNLEASNVALFLDLIKGQFKSGVILLLISQLDSDKVRVIISVSDDLATRLPAHTLLKSITQSLGIPGGGGRPTLSQTGIPSTLIEQIEPTLCNLIKKVS